MVVSGDAMPFMTNRDRPKGGEIVASSKFSSMIAPNQIGAQPKVLTMGMKMGMMGEVDYSKSQALKEPPSFYAKRNCWYGASFPSPADIKGRDVVGVDRILWGNDYPHYEGCYPYSRENMRLAFSDVDPIEVRMMLGENAAKLYDFDLQALRPLAEKLEITPELVRVPLDEIPEDSACPTFQRERYLRQRAGHSA